MKQILQDENGNNLFYNPQQRLSEIMEVLEPKLIKLKNEENRNNLKDKPLKIPFISQITNFLDAHLRLKPLIRYDYAILIDAELLQEFSTAFFELMLFIREYFPEFISNKQIFSAFCGISTSAFDTLSNSSNGDIVAITSSLLDSFIDQNFTSAMAGGVNGTTTVNRMKASGTAGYDVKIQSDSETKTNVIAILDNDAIQKQLTNIMDGNK